MYNTVNNFNVEFMTKILCIDSSPNLSNSHSRAYSKKVIEKIKKIRGSCEVIHRDLVKNQPPLVTEAWNTGAYKEESHRSREEVEALKQSDILIDEFMSSEYIVIGSPMHNFGISSGLKLYFDQIIRVNKTWTMDYKGLAKGKKVYIVMTRGGGGYEVGEPMHHMNQHEQYLRTILGFIGIKGDKEDQSFIEPQFIKINNISKGAEALKISYANADSEIESLKI